MKFAREEVRESMQGISWARRQFSALYVSVAAYMIVSSLVQRKAFEDAGLDADRAVEEMNHNSHFQSMIRSSCAHLMEFLDEVGLLTRPAMHYYRKVHML